MKALLLIRAIGSMINFKAKEFSTMTASRTSRVPLTTQISRDSKRTNGGLIRANSSNPREMAGES